MRWVVFCAVLATGCVFDASGDSDGESSVDASATVDGAVSAPDAAADAAAAGDATVVDAAAAGDATVVGSFFAQAEDFTNTVSLDGVNDWPVMTTRAGFTGTGYVRAGPDPPHDQCLVAGEAGCGAEVHYAFSVTVGGDYALSVRAVGEDGDSDSLWWGIDGAFLASALVLGPNGPAWIDVTSSQTVTIAPGSHVLNIRYREDGAELDTVALNRP